MTSNYIINMVERGMMSVDQLGVVTPILAKQRDPLAFELISYIEHHKLWIRWGFDSFTDFLIKTHVPEIVLQCSTAQMLADQLHDPSSTKWMTGGARKVADQILEDNPARLKGEEFMARLERFLAEQQKIVDARSQA